MRRAYHHGNLRATLLNEGVRLIEEKGVNGLTLREIGDRARVSRTAAYRHFADKAELLAAISEAGFLEFGDALALARDAGHPNFAARLDAMGLAYLRFAEAHRAYFEVMFGVGCDIGKLHPGASEAGARAFGILEDTIREGQAADEIRAGDSKLLATVLWALVHGIAMLRLETDLSENGAGTKFMLAAGELLRRGIQPISDNAYYVKLS